jgi:hypothetical protein
MLCPRFVDCRSFAAVATTRREARVLSTPRSAGVKSAALCDATCCTPGAAATAARSSADAFAVISRLAQRALLIQSDPQLVTWRSA